MVTPIESVQTDEPLLESQSTTQNIPVWDAYNFVSRENLPRPIDQAYALPIINAAAHEWDTFGHCFVRAQECESSSRSSPYPIITLDMDL